MNIPLICLWLRILTWAACNLLWCGEYFTSTSQLLSFLSGTNSVDALLSLVCKIYRHGSRRNITEKSSELQSPDFLTQKDVNGLCQHMELACRLFLPDVGILGTFFSALHNQNPAQNKDGRTRSPAPCKVCYFLCGVNKVTLTENVVCLSLRRKHRKTFSFWTADFGTEGSGEQLDLHCDCSPKDFPAFLPPSVLGLMSL